MSLRQRFVLIVSLAVVALVAAALGVVQLRAESQAAREAIAVEQCDAAVEELLHKVSDSSPSLIDPTSKDSRASLRSYANAVAAPLAGTAAGYCTPDGGILAHDSDPENGGPPLPEPGKGFHFPKPGMGPPDQGRPPGPPPDGDHPPPFDDPGGPPAPFDFDPGMGPPPRGPGPPPGTGESPNFSRALGQRLPAPDLEMIYSACSKPSNERIEHQRVLHAREVVLLSVRRAKSGELSAWSLVRVPPTPGSGGLGWPLKIGIMGFATLLLVGLTIDALLALRRGADDLERGLKKLKDDLRAPIPEPRAEELARIADGVRTMASHLADAQDRERALSAELGHEQRLAGLGRVVAGVAHEVRNPLAGIKLKLDQMARRKPDERSAGDIAICLQEIARLDRVVSSLLWVARKGPIEKVHVDLGDLVRERALAAVGVARGRDIAIAASGSGSAPANREEMTRVLDNLIRNAIEASPQGSEVKVLVEADDDEARITIEDRGSGIPEERRQELFEPFFTLKPDGTGLGLFLSRSLVEAHQGRLIYDRRGDTTRFTVSLPKESVDAAEHSHR